jgi:MOSC domain-containing protein YiiM
MMPVQSVEAVKGSGLVGDRYFGSKHRHVTVQAADALLAAALDYGSAIGHEATRRNITISDGPVPSAPGARLCIGDVELEVVRVAATCRVLNEVIGPGAAAMLRRRAGSVCRVLSSGTIAIGDVMRIGE